ncbi:hypothetical protein LAZ67_1004727 [Cordylochernes scorpioides]|uniref:Uncharacterized protein n=1 Tax=Cordylochernes scorpioides TaxID=51811 RepID=A0ABY6JYH6_9ARAC|nr:hypothetical protein LAZ67_1004727 [Cordylochernes scorpioides]
MCLSEDRIRQLRDILNAGDGWELPEQPQTATTASETRLSSTRTQESARGKPQTSEILFSRGRPLGGPQTSRIPGDGDCTPAPDEKEEVRLQAPDQGLQGSGEICPDSPGTGLPGGD